MKWMTRLLALCLLVSPAWAAMTIGETGACPLADVPDSVKSVLDSKGYQVKDGGNVFAEAWFAKDIKPGAGAGDRAGSDFKQLTPSVFLGVIRYAKEGSDFRVQQVKPGVYTMRYQLQPEDGDHLGTAPRRDFVVLLPAGVDTDPSALPDFKAVTDMSKKASGTPHPQVLHMMYPPSGTQYPSVITAGSEYQVLVAKVSGVELGIVLVGKGGD